MLKTAINDFLYKFLWIRFFALARPKNGALGQLGWLRPMPEALLVSGSTPMPWFTYGAIDYINHSISPSLRVLELGGGASTRYWSERGNKVTVVETDPEWAKHIASQGLENLEELISVNEISPSVLDGLGLGKFDVIVNDFAGANRPEVIPWIEDHLDSDGWLIWDDSDRVAAEGEINRLKERYGYVSFFGLGPVVSYATQTTIFSNGIPRPTWTVPRSHSVNY